MTFRTQMLALVALLAIILVVVPLWRAQRVRPGARLLSFVLASILAHAGLLFVLDLIVIAVPVVETHGTYLKEIVVKTFSLGTSVRQPARPWEGPISASPAIEPGGIASTTQPRMESATAPELRGMVATIPDVQARDLPPGRVLFIPPRSREAPSEVVGELPRAVLEFEPQNPEPVAPELPAREARAAEAEPAKSSETHVAAALDLGRPATDVIPPPGLPGPSRAPVSEPARPSGSVASPEVALPDLPRMRPLPEPEPILAEREMADPQVQLALRRPEGRKDVALAMGGNEATESAVERGLAWLAAHQYPDGHWSLHQFRCEGHQCGAEGQAQNDPAATALALMALLGAGHDPHRGSYAESTRRGLNWLIAQQRGDGDLAGPSGSQMYAHALATIAVCEALGLSGEATLRSPARRAVDFIVAAQDPNTGGWRYQPRVDGDTSVLGWQLMALKSAEMAGLKVPEATYRLAAKWLDSVHAGDKGLLYGYQPGREAKPSMTAEALLCRQYMGIDRRSEGMRTGAAYLAQNPPVWDSRNVYYWYYATQVLFHLQDERWAEWNSKQRTMLVESQAKDGPQAGSWHPAQPSADRWGESGGRLYETALSLLILEVYYRHLPLYQQLVGPGR